MKNNFITKFIVAILLIQIFAIFLGFWTYYTKSSDYELMTKVEANNLRWSASKLDDLQSSIKELNNSTKIRSDNTATVYTDTTRQEGLGHGYTQEAEERAPVTYNGFKYSINHPTNQADVRYMKQALERCSAQGAVDMLNGQDIFVYMENCLNKYDITQK